MEITPDDLPRRTREIAEYYLAHPSKSRKEISKDLGIHETRISQVLHHPKVRACYKVLARGRIADLIAPSVQAFEECIKQNSNMIVKLNAASRVLTSENVLDGPKVQVQHQISAKSIEELKAIVNRAQTLPSNVIDTEVIDSIDGEVA